MLAFRPHYMLKPGYMMFCIMYKCAKPTQPLAREEIISCISELFVGIVSSNFFVGRNKKRLSIAHMFKVLHDSSFSLL